MALFLAKKPLFPRKIPSSHIFKISSYFQIHLITLLLEILGVGYMGRPLPLNILGRQSHPSPLKSPPMTSSSKSELLVYRLGTGNTQTQSLQWKLQTTDFKHFMAE